MKVLREGTRWRSQELECTGHGNGGCGCGATLLVDAADLFVTSDGDPYRPTHDVSFRCPACGAVTDLQDPPQAAWTAAQENDRRRREAGR